MIRYRNEHVVFGNMHKSRHCFCSENIDASSILLQSRIKTSAKTCNTKRKEFNVLRNTYRHFLERSTSLFHAIILVVEITVCNEKPISSL